MKKLVKKLLLVFLLLLTPAHSENNLDFDLWLKNFKVIALNEGISSDTIRLTLDKARFLENVIKYDRKQPEFFEKTLDYISKRATIDKVKKAKIIYKKNNLLINDIESKFKVKKEILLALWSIETNFGKHVGKMDIISSLATLSFDKRRSAFFTKELLILLNLIDKNLINPNTLYGSWAGAYGNFQFMPSSINQYAIDYDKNNKIELKEINDSMASAANYLNKIGWNNNEICFIKVDFDNNIPKKFLNKSARNIKNYLKIKKWKKMKIKGLDNINLKDNKKAALIIPDGDINSPKYLVFQNYEKILKWNRSLRFAITVCTLADMIKNEI